MADQSKYDFSAVRDESMAEVLRLGELKLENQIRFALASDQRALVQAGIFGAIAAASLTILDKANAIPIGILFASMAVASGLAIWAARPVDFYVTGYQPKKLAVEAYTERQVRQFAAEDTQQKIDDNNALLEKASRGTLASFAIAIAGAISAAAAYGVATYLS